MNNTKTNHVACTHCACHNPMWEILEEDIFNPEHLSKATALLEEVIPLKPESLVIYGGTIRPMVGGSADTVEAIGIHGGKVIATGTKDSVISAMSSMGFSYKLKELEAEHTLLPGLIEPHVHIVPTALLRGWLDVSRFNGQDLLPEYDVKWLKETIQQHVTKHELRYKIAGEWLLARGLDPALMPFKVNPEGELNELVTIDYSLLDDIEEHMPMLILSASMHTLYANSKALKLIWESDGTLKNKYPKFEQYRDATNGQLQEADGMKPAFKAIPKLQVAAMALESFKHLTDIFQTASSLGITFLYDAGMSKQLKTVLDAYLLFHEKKLRIGAAQICYTQDEVDSLPAFEMPANYKDVYYGNIKLVSDGSNQGLTGYQSEPYCCKTDDGLGIFNFPESSSQPDPVTPPKNYIDLVKTIVADKNWPLMIHANGDRAVQFALDVYGEAAKVAPQSINNRNRIEHCSILTADQVKVMQQLGVSPSFLIGHVGYWGYAFSEAIFEEKAQKLDPCKTSLDADLRITLHSDNEVSPLGPLRMMEQAITRIMEAAPGNPEDNVLNEAECITPEQALRAVTYDAAWQCHADQWVGSLDTGLYADFVILKKDPLSLEQYYMNLRNIEVLETWKDGAIVYEHPARYANVRPVSSPDIMEVGD